MGSSSDDFALLRAALKLKRYEQPPPRFFDELPQHVHHRLRGPDGLREKSLFSLLGLQFGLKPAFFYGLGVTCCTLAVSGAVYLFVQDAPVMAESPNHTAMSPILAAPDDPIGGTASRLTAATSGAELYSGSTNPVLSTGTIPLPLDPIGLRVTPVNFDLGPR